MTTNCHYCHKGAAPVIPSKAEYAEMNENIHTDEAQRE